MLTRKILFGLAIALLASGSLVAQEAEKTAEKASTKHRSTKSPSRLPIK